MITVMTRRMFLLISLLVAACSSDRDRPRCANCGMFADEAPGWAAAATLADGRHVDFDSPKCMLGYTITGEGRGARERFVVEYYAQRRVPASSVQYVIGSDLVSPMGRDLVPVANEHVETFVHDHGGRALSFGAIDAAVLRSLAD